MFGAAEIFALIESFTRTTLTSEINWC
jgi:hypothetical protein